MAVSLTVSQARTIEAANTYKVVTTASAATGIPVEVFVYKADSAAFDHVATPVDLQTFPTTPSNSYAFYRSAVATQTFSDVNAAKLAGEQHKARVQQLVTDYAASVVGFVGSDSNVYTA